MDVFSMDNAVARDSQIAKIKEVRAQRDPAAVTAALDALTAAAGDENTTDNFLDLGIKAARARCTVGEISDALEVKWGRAKILSETITGAYASECVCSFYVQRRLCSSSCVLVRYRGPQVPL
jgi:methylmalonyl-CoA mutase